MIHIGAGNLAIEPSSSALRGALALACATGLPFRWDGFRRDGLRAEDAESVRLFTALSGARVRGGDVGDDGVELEPAGAASGDHRFEAHGDRSLLPLLRAALVPLSRSESASSLVLAGSTHAPGGETFEVTGSTFCFFLRELGIDVSVTLECAGFVPRGGGEVAARIASSTAGWSALTLLEREPLESIQIVSAGASLPAHVQQRQAARARSGVHISGFEPTVQLLKIRSRSAGSVVAVTGQFGALPITFASVSQRGKSAESVGEQAAAAFRRYANQPAVVPGDLVEPLLLFLAFAEGESTLTTPRLPGATSAYVELIRSFTGREVTAEGKIGKPGRVRVSARLQT